VIVAGNDNVGGATMQQTLNGAIPVIVNNASIPADTSSKNTYDLTPGVFSSDPGLLGYATEYAHAKTASVLYPSDDPTGLVAAQGIQKEFNAAGVQVTLAGYSSTAPDLLPAVQASGATSTDLVVALFVEPSTCISGAKALAAAHVTAPIIGLQLCIAPPIKAGLGDYPKWTYLSDETNPLDPTDAYTKGYLAAMKALAAKGANVGGAAQPGFVGVLAAVRAANRSGGPTATTAGIGQALASFPGPTPMFAPVVKYGVVPPLPDIGSTAVRFYRYKGKGKWQDVTGGKWVTPGS
jgi:branched-chain amino acid transport system substrate-binding protein